MTSIRPFSVRMACGGPSLPLRRQAPGGLRSWLPLHEPATSNRGAVRRAADTKGDILRRGGTSPEMVCPKRCHSHRMNLLTRWAQPGVRFAVQVPIAVALERAKRHHRNGKNHHEKQDRESAGSLVLSGRPAQLKVPKQLPSRSPAGSKGPETENSRKKNTIPLLPPPTAVPPSTDTISEVEFDWSRDDYRSVRRIRLAQVSA